MKRLPSEPPVWEQGLSSPWMAPLPGTVPRMVTGMNLNLTPMKVKRVEQTGEVREFEIEGLDLTNGDITFDTAADIEVGDEVSYVFPNGKTKTMEIVSVDVLQSPFPGASTIWSMDHTLAKYHVADKRSAIKPPQQIDIPGLHADISAVSGRSFAQANYDGAVFDALKAVEHRVKMLAGSPTAPNGKPMSGKPLITWVLNEQQPRLDTTSPNAVDQQRDDELEGFKYLFMGAIQGLRNPRGHGQPLGTSENEAREMLGLASLLMRMLDRAEQRSSGAAATL